MKEMNDLKGKKLLFLGATAAIRDIVLIAKEMGIKTYVTDYHPNAAAKEVADRSFNVSTTDVSALAQLIEKEGIEGIFTGFSDANLMPCRELADRFGFYFYATKEQIEVITNKRRFKQVCRECGLPVVSEYHIDERITSSDIERMEFPVIVKPADSYASKGITVCEDESTLMDAYRFAAGYSPTGQVIVERYISGWIDACLYFTVKNGNVTLSAMTDRDMHFTNDGHAQQPNVLYYPSQYIDSYYEKLDGGVRRYVEKLGIQNGTMFIQLFVNPVTKDFLIFESGYRLCGASEYILVSAENKINTAEMHLRYALTGRFSGWDNVSCDNPRFEKPSCILVILLNPGHIKEIRGLGEVRTDEAFLNMIQYYREGDVVAESSYGTFTQAFARVYLRAKNSMLLNEAIGRVRATLDVLDEKGNSLVVRDI